MFDLEETCQFYPAVLLVLPPTPSPLHSYAWYSIFRQYYSHSILSMSFELRHLLKDFQLINLRRLREPLFLLLTLSFAVKTAQPYQQRQYDPCEMDKQNFGQCLQTNNNDVTACQFVFEALQTCQVRDLSYGATQSVQSFPLHRFDL